MRKTALIATLALAAILPSTASSNPQGGQTPLRVGGGIADSAQRAGYVPGEPIVKFSPGFAPSARSDALHERGARLKRVRLPGRAVLARSRGATAFATP